MNRLALALVTLLLSSSAAAGAATLDGSWHVTGSISDNPVLSTCVIVEKETKLTGTCTGTDGKPVPISGSVNDKAVIWTYDTTYQGGTITLTYTATQDREGHLTGTVDVQPYSATGDFTATRDKPSTPPAAPNPAPAPAPAPKP